MYLGVGGSDSFQLSTGFIINPSHTTTEISIPEENESTVAYPNPATEVVTVRSSSKTFSARIINMAGQVVRERNGSNSITEFQVKDLQNGNYIIEINDGSKMEHKRFLKQ
ncbi:MAG: T9SS type A sorting domain-containing protein [Candidatus Pacebacteria bacterium]|nr:T9SS type A sorting domain-containing protein [Candidatus Paceibacterota bacterium]